MKCRIKDSVLIPNGSIRAAELLDEVRRIEMKPDDAPLETLDEYTFFWTLCGALERVESGDLLWDPELANSDLDADTLKYLGSALREFAEPGFVTEIIFTVEDDDGNEEDYHLYVAPEEWVQEQPLDVRFAISRGEPISLERLAE